MDLDFSAEQKQLRSEMRRFLNEQCPIRDVRKVLDGEQPYQALLWTQMGDLGYLGAAIPESYGGAGLGYIELCVLAEELGRCVAAVPFDSSIFMFAEFLKRAGSDEQKRQWLPRVASGDCIGTFAWSERTGQVMAKRLQAGVTHDRISGRKVPVPEGSIANVAVVAARDEQFGGALSLFLVDLCEASVSRRTLEGIDPTRDQAALTFDATPTERLGRPGDGEMLIENTVSRAAVLTAFQQVGGAESALEMARDYALSRHAFGRPIGSFQALKHMMADMYVSATLARSNAYFAAWALDADAQELYKAAAVARVSATQAYQYCAKNNIQIHGGMGFTWEFDCHLHYRRANHLAVSLGTLTEWEDRLIDRIGWASINPASTTADV